MATRDGIINEALRLLGEPASTSGGDKSSWARQCRDAYEPRLLSILEDYDWNFATVLIALTPSAPKPEDYEYGFQQPPDVSRILRVDKRQTYQRNTGADQGPGIHYDDREGRILANYETISLWYISDKFVESEGSFSQKFSDYLSASIAESVAPSMDLSERKIERIERALVKRKRDARAHDAQSKPVRDPSEGDYVNTRNRGFSGRGRGGRRGAY